MSLMRQINSHVITKFVTKLISETKAIFRKNHQWLMLMVKKSKLKLIHWLLEVWEAKYSTDNIGHYGLAFDYYSLLHHQFVVIQMLWCTVCCFTWWRKISRWNVWNQMFNHHQQWKVWQPMQSVIPSHASKKIHARSSGSGVLH
jgi:hypothetical protein